MSSKMIIIEGNSNDKDDVRVFMVKGEAGATIEKIEKTSTSGSVDTYTIYIDDGRTQTFTVTNGKTINSIEKTSTSGLVDTYTITFNDGDTQTFTVTNGKDGETYEVPTGSIIGYDGNTVPEGYEEYEPNGKILKAYTLFTGSTKGNVTLSDSSSNYNYIEIYYTYGNFKGYSKFLGTTQASVLSGMDFASNEYIQIFLERISISGTTITRNNAVGKNISNSTNIIDSWTGSINIIQVIGYKEV